jgi:hypothetical protein
MARMPHNEGCLSCIPAAVLLVAACNTAPAGAVTGKTAAASSQPPAIDALSDARTAEPGKRFWSFESEREGLAPAGFSFARTGPGRPGRWVVAIDPRAAGESHVLVQVDDDATEGRFLLAIAQQMSVRDVHLSVRCRMVSGRLHQACGLVARYRDERNYFLTRADALKDDIRLFMIQDGELRELASWSGEVTADQWHRYRFEVAGVHLQVFWDEMPVVDYRGDVTDAGRVGVWTHADSVIHFDDLRAEHF